MAGIATGSQRWVRPVSGRSSTGSLSPSDCSVDGVEVEPLDIVRIGWVRLLDDPTQPENLLVDETDWVRTGVVPVEDAYARLSAHIESGPELLGCAGDCMPDVEARQGVDSSLALVEPDAISFTSRLYRPGQRRQARAQFELSGELYDLSVTDRLLAPAIRRAGAGTFSADDLGFRDFSRIVLTVSLAGAWKGQHYKVVAAVLLLP